MKHPSHKFQTMAPSELMMYLDGKHYPVVRQLMAQLDIHMSEVLRMNIGARASIIRLDLEYRSLAVLVRGRLQRNEEVLFPFIYQTLDEGLSSFERFDKLEKEVEDLHSSHLQMRLHLADLSEFSHGFKPEPESSLGVQVVYSELHSLEGHLYRQFYLEAIVLIQKVNSVIFQSYNQFYIE